jgi:hypothetical protein
MYLCWYVGPFGLLFFSYPFFHENGYPERPTNQHTNIGPKFLEILSSAKGLSVGCTRQHSTQRPTFRPIHPIHSAAMTQPTPKREQRRWTPEDIEVLTDLTGELPWHMVVESFNQLRPPRTFMALQKQAKMLGISMQPQGEYISIAVIRTLTGYSNCKILNWIHTQQLPAVARSSAKNSPLYVSRKHLRIFAKKNPQHFGGIGRAQLTQLFDSEYLADKIMIMKLPRAMKSYEVVCVETGIKYPSIAAAAKKAFVDKGTIRNAVIKGTPAFGYHYRRVLEPTMPNLR